MLCQTAEAGGGDVASRYCQDGNDFWPGQSQAGSRRQNRVKEDRHKLHHLRNGYTVLALHVIFPGMFSQDKWWESPEVAQRDPSPEPAQAAQTLDEGSSAENAMEDPTDSKSWSSWSDGLQPGNLWRSEGNGTWFDSILFQV